MLIDKTCRITHWIKSYICDFEFVDTDFSFLFIMNRQDLSFKQRSLLFTVLLFRYSHLFVVNSIQSSFCRSINVWKHQFAIGQQLPCKIIRHIVSTCAVIIFTKMFREMRAPWLVRTSSLYFHKARAREVREALAFGSCFSALPRVLKNSQVLICLI